MRHYTNNMRNLPPRLLYLRRMGNSLHVTIPADFVREYELATGYAAIVSSVPNGIKLKFMNAADLTAFANATEERQEPANQHEAVS
jgi:antitoxin component of MazEF toxin-antitoxin module